MGFLCYEFFVGMVVRVFAVIIAVQICLRLQSVNAHLPIGEYVNVQLKCLKYANQKDGKIRL